MYHSWNIVRNPFAYMVILQFKSMKSRGPNLSYTFKKKKVLSKWIGEQSCMQMKLYICQHSWKIVRNPFAFMVVLQSMWNCRNHCLNFMESGSESVI